MTDLNNNTAVSYDNAPATQENVAPSNDGSNPQSSEQQSASWFFDENIPGQGDKPEWFNDRYKTVAEQAKGWGELRKKLGGFTGAPEEYNSDKFKDALDPAHDAFTKFAGLAKDLNMNQEGFEKVMDMFVEHNASSSPDTEKFIKELPPEKKEELKVLNQWALNSFSDKEYDILDSMVTDETSLNLMIKLSKMNREHPFPTTKSATTSMTREDIGRRMKDNWDDYVTNKNGFRDEIRKDLESLY